MKKQLDELLNCALTPMDEPSFWLNQKILNQVKEQKEMIGKEKRRFSVVTIVLTLVLCFGSITVYGAWKYVSSEDVAEKIQEDSTLAEAFLSEEAKVINETQSYGGYQITLLSMVSGELLTEHPMYNDGTIMTDRTYAVIAIENADGTPLPAPSEDAYAELEFFVSPLMKGYNPVMYNIFTMSGAYGEMEEDGILYRLLECNNVENLETDEIYIRVSDGVFYNARAYQYDETTGEISRNEAYECLNALFVLPMEE